MSLFYPPSPQNVPPSLTQPSKAYAANIGKVMVGIVLFILLYILLLVASVFMLYYGVIVGLFIISLRVNLLTIGAGGGIVALTVMFCWFLIKFIFKTRHNENPQRVEIFEKDYPELFAFIYQVATDVKAPKPKSVFLSPDVNACVFYNSSFLSLFFPVSKNLEIGLGLVNSLNISEFKAVLAHEFGHFSQRSMKLGSYTYTVNHILYDLIYEYDNWDATLVKWAEVGGVFSWFAVITFRLVQGVRWILRKAFEQINLAYMSLSREMEYHADSIAVSLAGSKAISSALRRIEFGSSAYQSTIHQLNRLAEEKIHTNNAFVNHKGMIAYLANAFQLQQVDNLPVITDEMLKKHTQASRVYIKDQWASHPSLSEREANIFRAPVDTVIDQQSPWVLFGNVEAIQQRLTKLLYSTEISEAEKGEEKQADEAQQMIVDYIQKEQPDPMYNDYYDNRYLELFDVETSLQNTTLSVPSTINKLFTDEIKEKITSYNNNRNDLDILANLRDGHTQARTFDFDGKKYHVSDSNHLFTQLEQEVQEQQQWMQRQDETVFRFYYLKALEQSQEQADVYKQAMKNHLELQTFFRKLMDFRSRLQMVQYWASLQQHWVEDNFNQLKQETISLHGNLEQILLDSEKLVQPAPNPNQFTLRTQLLQEPLTNVLTDFTGEVYNQFIHQSYDILGKGSEMFDQSFKHLMTVQKDILNQSEVSA
ncbi:M48 family metallopeptidase [Xanthocytophaga agilis]|uniref:M48 family metallopeptidase n=1 Tax=Xanthocytophaga agilis TaxID=3048010 RepID=A0AAE3UHP2_9BACT|nr:M48 family metallopeptidase [Xanthocytophaga agilis]MDJ1502848.1 M48 family metallopeptidase [Xanthocytophaga agilis]